ncbi:hypothetical protein C8J57DRAFT_1293412 [Mycena rebaudengoi]|nr:hypothetical protein C8J57DRAFT_1293412 [Mycena rebaudengoi]
MRSPTGKTPVVHFCASCDDAPIVCQPHPASSLSDNLNIGVAVRPPPLQTPSSSVSIASSSHISRTSTPPTEVSSTLSSPTFALPAETEESRRRREQSDAASSAIGQRLLKGWAMLADECPNRTCFGVPLVRPPKAGGEKDPRKECVICGTVYTTEVDWAGRERLVPAGGNSTVPITADKGKTRDVEIPNHPSPALEQNNSQTPQMIVKAPPVTSSVIHGSSILSTLNETVQGLEGSLRALSARLTSLTAGHTDPLSIGANADAIAKVVQALTHVRQLQWAETHAGETV